MIDSETFEFILLGPDGQIFRGKELLVEGVIPTELAFLSQEGPFALTSRYARTSHKIEGRFRFNWIDSERIDNGTTYRLASVDGLGAHGLVNDRE